MVTQRDIAERVGVDRTAVSRVLAGKGKSINLSDKMIARIEEAAREMGYRPNLAARATVEGKFSSVGLLYRDRQLFPERNLGAGVTEALVERDYHVTLAPLPEKEIAAQARGEGSPMLPRLFRELCVDGLLVYYAIDVPQDTFKLVREQKVPTVWLDMKGDADCVYVDEVDGVRRATHELIEAGHRRIGYLGAKKGGGDRYHHSFFGRKEGYQAAMAAAGLSPDILATGDSFWRDSSPAPDEDQLAELRDWLCRDDRPTAIVGYDPHHLFSTAVVASQLGLSVPDDLCLSGFSQIPIGAGRIPVRTWIIPMHEIGYRGVEVLIKKMEAPADAIAPSTVSYTETWGTLFPPKS